MNTNKIDLTLLVPEFPQTPEIEIARDGLVKRIAASFGPDCQKQAIISDDYYGKTNLIAQFCRQYSSNSISYFITANPITQNYRNFLYIICNQMSKFLKGEILDESITEVDLRKIVLGLSVKLSEYAKQNNKTFFIVIDGVEQVIESESGRDIITNPPTTSKFSPYLLITASNKIFQKLPDQIKCGVKINEYEPALQFNIDDTEKYLDGLNLDSQDIRYINDKSKGVAGYLAIVRDSIKTSGKNWIYKDVLPDNLLRLIKNQVEHVLSEVNPIVKNIIEIVSVSPKPIGFHYLREYFQAELPFDEINRTELLIVDNEKEIISLKHDLAKSIINQKLEGRKEILTKTLLEVVQKNPEYDGELLTLLLEELKDYNGLVSLLSPSKIKLAIDTGKTNTIISRIRAILKLALQTENLEELSKWGWGLAATKEFLSQTSTTWEINALISLGDSNQALEMAYNCPELITKIRLLANIYSTMKARHEHVPASALSELELMIDEISLENFDKELIRKLAFDLIILFPDKAMSLIDSIVGDQNIVDAAITTNNSEINEVPTNSFLGENIDRQLIETYNLTPTWLKKFNLANLIKEVEGLKSTKTKEYLIRQWCEQKEKDEELPFGIEFWLDTVITDENFIISLRSLRKISDLLTNLHISDRRRIIKRLQISSIASLRSPWQEWVGFHLNVAEATYEFDKDYAKEEIEEIYQVINTQIDDLDIKVFCYAKLWGTCKNLNFINDQDIKNNLERVLSDLLRDSALQDEILLKTIMIIANIDIDYSLEIGDRLNTEERRKLAKKTALIKGYTKQPQKDFSSQLRKFINDLDYYDEEIFIFDFIDEISKRELTIDNESQRLLLVKARVIKNQIKKSITLVKLASIWSREDIIKIPNILREAEESWTNENDLKKKIIYGYMLVEKIAKIDLNYARNFYKNIQSTQLYAGAELAVGGLGTIFTHSLDLAIRSLDGFIILDKENIDNICDQIIKLPNTILQHQLYAQLAGKLFKIGNNQIAGEIVQDKILQNLAKVENYYIRERIINFSLPVILWYSQNEAIKLSEELPNELKNSSWFSAILWSLGNGLIGDIYEFDLFKVPSNNITIREKALFALEQIKEDSLINAAVKVITQSLEYSIIANKLDIVNAFDILSSIEDYVVDNLPDMNNIMHPGYKIVALARINGAKAQIYKDSRKKINVSQIDIKRKWTELVNMANTQIENIADRIYVLTIISKEMHSWDKDKSEELLTKLSDSEINTIPALVDRMNRIELIAQTWGKWEQKSQAQYFYNQLIRLINELSPLEQDRKLESIIQAAYEISPKFADALAEQLDSRFTENEMKQYQRKLRELHYSSDLQCLISDSNNDQSMLQGSIIKSCTRNLLNDLFNENGTIPSKDVLLETLYLSGNFEPDVITTVLKWVLECENRQKTHYKKNYFDNFIMISEFTHNLASWISPMAQKGISQDLINILPGLSSKVHVFEIGQRNRAEDWIRNWIKQNTEKYIKICDPYFGPRELPFINDIRREIKIIIITTDEKFERKDDIKNELLESWRRFGKGNCPPMTIFIVPSKLHETFHDRAIITDKCGLNIGPSLNSLGNKRQNLTELEFNEAKELEKKYIDDMFNQVKWITDYSINPEFIKIE